MMPWMAFCLVWYVPVIRHGIGVVVFSLGEPPSVPAAVFSYRVRNICEWGGVGMELALRSKR